MHRVRKDNGVSDIFAENLEESEILNTLLQEDTELLDTETWGNKLRVTVKEHVGTEVEL